MYYSVTWLKLSSIWKLPQFFRLVAAIDEQLKDTPGVIEVKKKPLSPWVWCTLTHWDNKESMTAFRNSGAHLNAMKETSALTQATRSHGGETKAVVDWGEALSQLEAGSA